MQIAIDFFVPFRCKTVTRKYLHNNNNNKNSSTWRRALFYFSWAAHELLPNILQSRCSLYLFFSSYFWDSSQLVRPEKWRFFLRTVRCRCQKIRFGRFVSVVGRSYSVRTFATVRLLLLHVVSTFLIFNFENLKRGKIIKKQKTRNVHFVRRTAVSEWNNEFDIGPQ